MAETMSTSTANDDVTNPTGTQNDPQNKEMSVIRRDSTEVATTASSETTGGNSNRTDSTTAVTASDASRDAIGLVESTLRDLDRNSPRESSTASLMSASHSSSTSTICRICQLTYKETGEAISTTECDCRGGLELVHRSCLVQWVTYKNNNKCELCGEPFPNVTPPNGVGSSDMSRRHRLASVYQQFLRLRPMTRRKRAVLCSLTLLLALTTSGTGVLTVSTERRFQELHGDPLATGKEQSDSYITFSICFSFLLFCGTLTIGVLLVWLVLEGSYIHRRQRFYNTAQNILRNDVMGEMYRV